MIKKETVIKIGLWSLVPLVLFTPLLPLIMMLFIGFPWISGVIGAGFIFTWFKKREIWLLIAGIGWLLYSGYEYMMHLRIWCSGECNIRVDLLVIFPLLVYLSLRAIKAVRKQKD